MKVYDKDTPVKGPVDHQWLERGSSSAVPSENHSLMELQTSPGFRLLPNQEMIETGKEIVEDIEGQQKELKRLLLYGLLRDDPDTKLMDTIKSSYSKQVVEASVDVIKRVLAEKGVFGRVYIDSKLFPQCQNGEGQDLIKKHCSKALYLRSKKKCAGCVKNSEGICLSYEKKLVDKVPYNAKTLEHYRSYLAREKGVDPVQLVESGKTVKEALKTAFRTSPTEKKRVARGANVLPKTYRKADKFVSREDLILSAKIAHKVLAEVEPDLEDYKGTVSYQKYAVDEKGLFGHLYVNLDLWKGDCKKAKTFLDSVGNTAPFVVSTKACDHYDQKAGKCKVLGRYIVKEMDYSDDLVVKEALKVALNKGQITNVHVGEILSRIESMDSDGVRQTLSKLSSLPQLQEEGAISTEAITDLGEFEISSNVLEGINFEEYANNPITAEKHTVLRKKVRAYTIAKMNEGFYGDDLYELLRFKFGMDSLAKVKEDLKEVLSEQGLMGVYYVEPSVYASCDEGSKIHRTRGTKYVQAMKACQTCTANSDGFCQKYNKQVVASVPYIDKKAQQDEVLSRNSTESLEPIDVMSYQSVLDQFEIQNMGLENFSIDEVPQKESDLEIQSGGMILDFD